MGGDCVLRMHVLVSCHLLYSRDLGLLRSQSWQGRHAASWPSLLVRKVHKLTTSALNWVVLSLRQYSNRQYDHFTQRHD